MRDDEIKLLAASIVSVEVEALNDSGDIHYALGTAPSVDQAVREAVQEIRDPNPGTTLTL